MQIWELNDKHKVKTNISLPISSSAKSLDGFSADYKIWLWDRYPRGYILQYDQLTYDEAGGFVKEESFYVICTNFNAMVIAWERLRDWLEQWRIDYTELLRLKTEKEG
jgi:hypothetical protein